MGAILGSEAALQIILMLLTWLFKAIDMAITNKNVSEEKRKKVISMMESYYKKFSGLPLDIRNDILKQEESFKEKPPEQK